ncbi:MAG: Wzz/FepE/Etk N-terminal domain-containing protein [Candidatus Limousia pullorum]|nr:Wzz/FepE/Etk N-terminal domain-containing protein [Candidatus Limousia pullorum]
MDFLNMLKKHLKMVIILSIIGCILALSYSFLLVTPQYTASSLILIQNYEVVNNNGDEASTDEYRVYSSDLQASATLAKNCSILFSADTDMRAVLGSSKMSVSSMDESNFLKITITSDNPQVAADTANKIADMSYDVYLRCSRQVI